MSAVPAFKMRTYSRPLDLPPLPELQKIELHDPQFSCDLCDLSRDQLRTALLIFALRVARRRLAPLQPITWTLDECLARESEIRCQQLTHEANLRRGK